MTEPAWARFARRRLALSRWQCEPGNILPADKPAFDAAWQRQQQLEEAVATAASSEAIPEAVLTTVASSLAAQLNESDFSLPERQAVIRHHALMELQFARIAESAPQPDEAQVMVWYRAHQAQFVRPEQRLTSHLLLTVDDDRAAVLQQITRFHAEITRTREAFSRLAQRYSHCPSALEGGRLGWISRGLLYPELENALFALAENALSQPVETLLGWHLLWCEQTRAPEPMAQEEALAKVREHLHRQSREQWQRQWLTALARDC